MLNICEYLVSVLLGETKLPGPITIAEMPEETFRSVPYWISPQASLYPAGESHSDFAAKYIHPELELEEAKRAMLREGWVRVRTHPTQGVLELQAVAMTPAQQAVVQSMAEKTGLEIQAA